MGILGIFKEKKNNLEDLFEIPCDYDGYDFIFKSNITNPKIYEEITKVLTNSKLRINNLDEYKKLNKDSDMETFYEFYDSWLDLLRKNKYIIHLDKQMSINDFVKAINELLSILECGNRIDEVAIVEKYNSELKKYSLNNKRIDEEINYDILQANVVVRELRNIGYELICFFNGYDNEDKTIIPIDKINEFKEFEKALSMYENTDLKKENFCLNDGEYEFECHDFKLVIDEDIFDNDTVDFAKKVSNKYLNEKDKILNYLLDIELREFYGKNLNYSDDYIKNNIGKPQITINFKKDKAHPEWKFDYAGIIDFTESKLDEHLISIEFRDELILDDYVQLNG